MPEKRFARILKTLAATASAVASPLRARAQEFDDGGIGGLQGGIDKTKGVGGISAETSIVVLTVRVLGVVLDVIILVAIVGVIVAGIYLIVGNGDEGNKDKARKIIIYIVVGLIIILLARVIVLFVNSLI